jgi:hypothetical protein
MWRRVTVYLRSVLHFLVAANVVPSSRILVIMMMEAMSSSETSVLLRATQRNIAQDRVLIYVLQNTADQQWSMDQVA